jgi:hypothetical protein
MLCRKKQSLGESVLIEEGGEHGGCDFHSSCQATHLAVFDRADYPLIVESPPFQPLVESSVFFLQQEDLDLSIECEHHDFIIF